MSDRKIIILATESVWTNMLVNAISKDHKIEKIIYERPVSWNRFLKRRIKKLGLFKVMGQIFFKVIIIPYLEMISRDRVKEVMEKYHLDGSPVSGMDTERIRSVNSDESIALIKEINPDIVVIIGTRILKGEVLNSISGRYLNMHTGITPQYRGVHGAYWALVEADRRSCGVTIHFVDVGIDTGEILQQEAIEPSTKDNFVTYPYLQFGVGLPLLKKAIKDVIEHNVEIITPKSVISKLRTHPTFFGYLYNRFKTKVG